MSEPEHAYRALPELLRTTADRAARHLMDVADRAPFPDESALGLLDALDGSLPEGPEDPAQTIELLDRASRAMVGSPGGRYFGFVIGGVLPAALGASWLNSAWDQNAFSAVSSPAAARIEETALRWTLEVLGLPETTAGAFVTGTTMGHVTALAASRHALLARRGWDVEADGLAGAPPITIVAGEEAHATLGKAIALLGLGRSRVRTVPTDDQGAIRPDALGSLDDATIVCAQSGNVNTGAFDPLAEICDRAHARGAWVHVDGAFGLWAAANPATRHLTEGLERVDSWATDFHKWLNVTYDSGLTGVRDADALRRAFSMSASYLMPSGRRDPMDYTPESSRRARGTEVWAALRSLGRSGVADLVERCCRFARRFAEALSAAGHEVRNDVVLNQVLVSFGDDTRTRRVIDAIQREGTCWAGESVWRGRVSMRISVSSWATTDQDVERSIRAILAAAEKTA